MKTIIKCFGVPFLHGLQILLFTLVNTESFLRTLYLIDTWPKPLILGVDVSTLGITNRKGQGHISKGGAGFLSSTVWILVLMCGRLIILVLHHAVYKVPL